MNEELELQRLVNQNRAHFHDKVGNKPEKNSFTYIGYDASLKLAILRDTEGNICYGKPNTNGAIAIGQQIRMRGGGNFIHYDQMPYSAPEEQSTPNTLAKEILEVDALYTKRIEKEEDEIPNLGGQYYFYGGRCRPRLRSSNGGDENICDSLAECQANFSLVNHGYQGPIKSPVTIVEDSDFRFESRIINQGRGRAFNISLFNRFFYGNALQRYFSNTIIFLDSSYPTEIEIIAEDFFASSSNGFPLIKQSGIWITRSPITLDPGNSPFVDSDYDPDRGESYIVLDYTDFKFDDFNFSVKADLPAGRNWITILFVLEVDAPRIPLDTIEPRGVTVNWSGSVEAFWNPPPEPIRVDEYYLRTQVQNKSQPIADQKIYESLTFEFNKIFLVKEKNATYINHFFWARSKDEDDVVNEYQYLRRLIIQDGELIFDDIYTNPQEIPPTEDWLNSAYQYIPGDLRENLGDLGLCFSQDWNFGGTSYFNGKIYQISPNQQINDKPLLEAIKISDVTADIEVYAPQISSGACEIGGASIKKLNLPQLPQGSDSLKAMSLITRKIQVKNG